MRGKQISFKYSPNGISTAFGSLPGKVLNRVKEGVLAFCVYDKMSEANNYGKGN